MWLVENRASTKPSHQPLQTKLSLNHVFAQNGGAGILSVMPLITTVNRLGFAHRKKIRQMQDRANCSCSANMLVMGGSAYSSSRRFLLQDSVPRDAAGDKPVPRDFSRSIELFFALVRYRLYFADLEVRLFTACVMGRCSTPSE
jgi:hypothetical protein